MIITIHYDFRTGRELSYTGGKLALMNSQSFVTHCLDFFDFDCTADDVIVLKYDGTKISRNSLLTATQSHTPKQVRRSHNIQKMLKAGALTFR